MRISRRMRATVAIVLAAAAAVAAIAFVPALRSGFARGALAIALHARYGYSLAGGRIDVRSDRVVAEDLAIEDDRGEPLFSASRLAIALDPRVWSGRSDRLDGIESIEIDAPVLRVVKRADGSYNIAPLLAARGASLTAQPLLDATLQVRGGTIAFVDPAAVPIGRSFSIDDLDVSGDIDGAAASRVSGAGVFAADTRRSPLSLSYSADAAAGWQRADVRAASLPPAPIVDGIVPTQSFVVRGGTVEAFHLAASAASSDASSPSWIVEGAGVLRHASVEVAPFVTVVDDVNGPLTFAGGELTTSGLRGDLEGSPVRIGGGVRLIGGVRLDLSIASRQSLSRLHDAFSFSRDLDVDGTVDIAARVDGPPSALDVSCSYAAPSADYGAIPLEALTGTLFYSAGHLSLPDVHARYDGADVAASADVDLTGDVARADIDVVASSPASAIPVAANVNPSGTVRTIVELDGPIAALQGWSYAELVGGDGVVARTAIYAGPTHFAVGPMLVDDPAGGEMMLRGAIDRAATGRVIEGDAIARAMPLRFIAAAASLPGIGSGAPIAIPSLTGSIDGTAIVRGDETAPAVAVDVGAEDVVMAGERLGRVRLIAAGSGGAVAVRSATIDGPDARIASSGVAAVLPRAHAYALALSGTGRIALDALATATSMRHSSGAMDGSFSAAASSGRWTLALRAAGDGATVAGMGVESVDASLGGGGGGPSDVYAGNVALRGGTVAAVGTLPSAGAGDLRIWSPRFDLRMLRGVGVRVDRGEAVAFAHVTGTRAKPDVALSTIVDGGAIGKLPLSGDVDVAYAGGRLTARDGDIAVGRSYARVSGAVTGVAPGADASRAALDLDATMTAGDLGSLAGPFLPPSVDLQGAVAARLRIGGTIARPTIVGTVDADSGSLRGVAFDALSGGIVASAGSVRVSGGSVSIGSSHFGFSGSLSADALHLRASSAAVRLADFNDFFDGYDTLEGRGSGDIAFQSTKTGVSASGRVDVRRASVAGFPLGTVDATFASRGDELLAHMRQSGNAGTSDISGSVSLGRRASALPDFRSAVFDVRGSASGVDLGQVAPLIGRESIDLTGLLDVQGRLRGSLSAPTGHAAFDLRGGRIGKVQIDAASGSIDTDGTVTRLENASIDLPFADARGAGSYGPGKRIAASATIEASDIDKLFAAFGHPGLASGTANATVTVAGTSSQPRITTAIASGKGSLDGIAFDSLTGTLTYAPGEIDIADAEADLGGGKGAITIGGTLPLQLKPYGLGPKDRPISLAFAARAVDLSAFSPLTSRYLSLSGTLDAQVDVTGTAGRPNVEGAAHLRRGGATSPRETVPATDVSADLSLDRDTLTLTHLAGVLGRGRFAGSGAVHIVPAAGLLKVAGLSYWTRLNLDDVDLDVPGWVSGTANGLLRVTKSGTTPFMSGDLSLGSGNVPFSAIYELASGYGSGPAPSDEPLPGVPEVKPGHIVVYGGPVFGDGPPQVRSDATGTLATPPPPTLPSIDLDIEAGAGSSVRVHGGAIDLTATGGVNVGGNLRSPTLAGTFTSTRGQIGYFDTNFRLVRGSVTFIPAEGLLPTLDVQAITDLSGVEITLRVTGRVDNLQTDLSSNPSLPRDQIVSILLHEPQVNSVIAASPSKAQSELYAEAQSYFNAQLTRSLLFPVESLLAQSLDVEQISLIYDQNNAVDVEIRKLVTPTVYAIYRSSLYAPVTQTEGVAYSLRDYADLEVLETQSTTGVQQTLLNLRVTFH